MKNFFASMLGTLAGLMVFAVGGVVLLAVTVGVIATMGDRKPVAVEQGAYLVFDLSAVINDAPPQASGAALLAAFGGEDNGPKHYQLREVTAAIRLAADDSHIGGVFLHGHLPAGGGNYGNGYAALKEVRAALAGFKAAGKPVIAYLDDAGTRDMFVASIANELILDPYGLIMMPGLSAEPVFFAGAFEKFGIGVQVTRVGKFKAAVEPFTRRDMSPENRQQTQKLLDDVWNDLLADTAAGRELAPADLQALVDKEGMIRPEAALKARLISRIAYRDEVLDELKAKTGQKKSAKTFKQVSLASYIDKHSDRGHGKGRGQIAVVYAEGAIVDGNGETGEVGGVKFARELRRLRQDSGVKAIVLRVNSPGGSASASEHIQRELRLAREVKPVIVSMGTYAASGGYWISTYGDRIYAEPTTITGSIGVFGLMVNFQKLANDLGFTFDRVKTGKFADALSPARPKTEEELAVIQGLVDWIYGEFVQKVSESRGLDHARVQEIAQGRVWSGIEAQKLGLVDEIGGLDAALRYAAQKAGLGENYRLTEFPAKKGLSEMVADMLEGLRPASSRAGAVSHLVDSLRTEIKTLNEFNDARGIYARIPFEIRIK